MAKKRKTNANPANTSRVRGSDLAEAVVKLDSNKKAFSHDPPKVGMLVFTMYGQNDYWANINGYEMERYGDDSFPVLDDAEYEDGGICPADKLEEAYAKIQHVQDGESRYYIRLDSDGTFFNPDSLIGNRDVKRRYNAVIDKQKWGQVNKRVFLFYLNFLKTRNQAWLKNAERGV